MHEKRGRVHYNLLNDLSNIVSFPVTMADDDSIPKYSPEGLSHDSAEEDPFENARKAGKVWICLYANYFYLYCHGFHTDSCNIFIIAILLMFMFLMFMLMNITHIIR